MRKDSAVVVRPGLARREQELTSRLDALLGKHKGSMDDSSQPAELIDHIMDVPSGGEDIQEPAQLAVPESILESIPVASPHEQQAPPRQSFFKQTVQRLYDSWVAVIPTLEDDYLTYMERAQGRLGRSPHGEPHHCASRRCPTRNSSVQCLYADCTSITTLHTIICLHLFKL